MSHEECIELKNIKYQTMLIKNTINTPSNKSPNINNIELFLKKEIENNTKLPWSKLDQGTKIKKMHTYIVDYTLENNLSIKKTNQLTKFLKICLDRRKLQRIKDVVYDTGSGKIINIPNLLYNKNSNQFYLKKTDKKNSTLSCLAPKPKSKERRRRKKKSKTSKESKKD